MLLTTIAASSLPCMDVSVSTDGKLKKEIAEKHDQEQDHKNSDNCSPFCTCSCCSSSVFYSVFYKMQARKILFTSEKYPLIDIVLDSEVFSSIWQPPRIS